MERFHGCKRFFMELYPNLDFQVYVSLLKVLAFPQELYLHNYKNSEWTCLKRTLTLLYPHFSVFSLLHLSNKWQQVRKTIAVFHVPHVHVVDTLQKWSGELLHHLRSSHILSEKHFSDDKSAWIWQCGCEVLQIHFSRQRGLVPSTPCVVTTNPGWAAPQMPQQSVQLTPLC